MTTQDDHICTGGKWDNEKKRFVCEHENNSAQDDQAKRRELDDKIDRLLKAGLLPLAKTLNMEELFEKLNVALRKGIGQEVDAYLATEREEATIQAFNKAKHDVDFAKRWNLSYEEVVANFDESIRVLEAELQRRKEDDGSDK